MDFQARISSDEVQIQFWRAQRIAAFRGCVFLSLGAALAALVGYKTQNPSFGVFTVLQGACALYCWDRLYRYARRCERRAIRRKERDVRAFLDPEHRRHYWQ